MSVFCLALDITNPPEVIRAHITLTLVSGVGCKFANLGPKFQSDFRNSPWPVSTPPVSLRAEAIDAHCHLLKCAREEDRPIAQVVEQAYARLERGQSFVTPRLVGAVDVHAFPRDWTLDLPPTLHARFGQADCEISLRHAAGIHPTVKFDEDAWRGAREIIGATACFAVGECGLDSRSTVLWDLQMSSLEHHCRAARALSKPLVLHLRGRGVQDTDSLAADALKILSESRLAERHPIHIHSYCGSLDLYRRWLRRFPSTIFGISKATLRANQIDFASVSELQKLVLESDAPYQRTSTGAPRSPLHLADLAEWVAKPRGLPTRVVLGATAHTAARFYSLVPSGSW